MASLHSQGKVLLGHISGLFGVKGWVKVYSHTRPREQIAAYKTWYLGDNLERAICLRDGRAHKQSVVAKLAGIDDRQAAVKLLNYKIWVDQSALALLPADEFYWYQLIGLRVFDSQQKLLGIVTDMLETGANDVLIVRAADKTEHLIPYLKGQVVQAVDVEKKCLVVDWNIDF